MEHGGQTIGLLEYLTTGHFIEAAFENWESEFLQMASFVVLTVFLRQKGSSESKKLEGDEAVDAEPDPKKKDAPGPVRRGGLVARIYGSSLTIALVLLFVMSFALHAFGGAEEYNEEQVEHGGGETVSTLSYVFTSRFWFESLQNW